MILIVQEAVSFLFPIALQVTIAVPFFFALIVRIFPEEIFFLDVVVRSRELEINHWQDEEASFGVIFAFKDRVFPTGICKKVFDRESFCGFFLFGFEVVILFLVVLFLMEETFFPVDEVEFSLAAVELLFL